MKDNYPQPEESEQDIPGYETEEPEEKRMAGDYEIIQAIQIGDQEIVLGENPQVENDEKYMCAYCQTNELFAQYSEVMCSDNFAEIVGLFGQRVAEQAEKTRIELNKPKIQGIDDRPITALDCIPVSYDDDLRGKILVIKPEILRREYRRATCQLKLCTGGFGASPRSRGSACFCVDLYTGKPTRFERRDVLGTIEPDHLPRWAQHGLLSIQQDRAQKEKDKGAR